MPRPTNAGSAYRPGLDGLRAVAVAGVVAYHAGVTWMPGGLLGVGVFFTLSGYLITAILVTRWQRDGSLGLGGFWLARARRLLPALFVMLAAVLLAAWWIAPATLPDLLRESGFAALYISNWTDIFTGDSYFEATSAVGALDHLWSLAVEEQFYLLWPLALWGLLRLTRGNARAAAGGTLVLTAASFALLWLLASPGFDNTRAYEGTDTRAGQLLLGAALAIWWRGGIRATAAAGTAARARAPWWLDALAGAGLAGIVALMFTLEDFSMTLYRGGLLALAVATLAVVAGAAHPQSWSGRVLGVAPLRWVGERSYAIYLWHLPVIAFIPAEFLPGAPWLQPVIAVALTVGISALSWRLVEDPIRRHGFAALIRRRRVVYRGLPVRAPVAAASLVAVVLGGAAVIAASPRASAATTPPPIVVAAVNPDKYYWIHHLPVDYAEVRAGQELLPPPDPELAGMTSCTSILHVGDSTSLGMISTRALPDPADRLDAQFAAVGIDEVRLDILGARSIVERWRGQPNAQEAVKAALNDGFDGCFVIAMGLNEAANVAVGGQASLVNRIEAMQQLTAGRPTMWTTVRTQRTNGPWAQAEMDKMNAALLEACRRHPNMRVYDWAGEVQPSWFGSDRIHYTPEGDRQHARRIAEAVSIAWPAEGPVRYQCLVRTDVG